MESGKQVKIELSLPDTVYADLCKIAEHLGLAEPTGAALIAVTQWVAARKADLDDRDPAERYFINEALEELFARQKKS